MQNKSIKLRIAPCLLFLLGLITMVCGHIQSAAMPQQNGMPQMSPQDMQAFDQELQKLLDDPQAMQEMAEFAEKLMAEDPEFKKLVEDMTVEMEEQFKKEGIDLNQLPQQQPTEVPAPAQPIEEPKEVKPTKPAVSKKTIQEIKNILQTIADKLADIRQKALDDTAFKKLFEPWQFHTDDIIYYANALQEDTVIKYLAEKEFEQLYETLKLFAQALEELEPKITPHEFNIDNESPYLALGISPTASFDAVETAYRKKMQEHKAPAVIAAQMKSEGRTEQDITAAKKQATKERTAVEKAYNEIRTYEESKEHLRKLLEFDLRTIVHTQNIKEQVKKLLATYEPEALKTQQATEKEQAEARKKQEEAARRIPPYSPPTFYTPSYNQYPGADGYQDYYPPYQDYYTPPATTAAPAEQAIKLDENGKKSGGSGSGRKSQSGAKDKKAKDSDDKKTTRKPEADPKVEVALATLETYLDLIVEALEKPVLGTTFSPKTLFEDPVAFKNLLEKATYTGDEAQINAIRDSLTELTDKLYEAKKKLVDKMKNLTFAQKESIKKKAQELFNRFKKDSFDNNIPSLMKLNLAANDDLMLDAAVINLAEPNKKYILRGQGTITDKTIVVLNPAPAKDFMKDFIESLNKLKTEIGIKATAAPAAPAPAPAPAAAGS